MSDEDEIIDRIRSLIKKENRPPLLYFVDLSFRAVLDIDERLKAIEKRLDEDDQYQREQVERE